MNEMRKLMEAVDEGENPIDYAYEHIQESIDALKMAQDLSIPNRVKAALAMAERELADVMNDLYEVRIGWGQ
jgi:hypothetical protein